MKFKVYKTNYAGQNYRQIYLKPPQGCVLYNWTKLYETVGVSEFTVVGAITMHLAFSGYPKSEDTPFKN